MIFWLGKKAGGSFFSFSRRQETLVLISFPLKEIHFRDDGGWIDMLKKLLLVGLVFWKRKERWKECIGTLRLCAKNCWNSFGLPIMLVIRWAREVTAFLTLHCCGAFLLLSLQLPLLGPPFSKCRFWTSFTKSEFSLLLCRWTSWSLRRRYGQIQLLLCVDTPGRPRCRMVPQWRQSRSSPARTDPILEKEVRQTRNWIWWEAFFLKIAIGFVQEFDSYSICGIARRRAVVDPSQEHPIDGPGTENDSMV